MSVAAKSGRRSANDGEPPGADTSRGITYAIIATHMYSKDSQKEYLHSVHDQPD